VWTAIVATAAVPLPLLCGKQQLLLLLLIPLLCGHWTAIAATATAAPTTVWTAIAATAAVLLPLLRGQQ